MLLKLLKSAHNKRMKVIGFLGGNGGKLKTIVDLPIVIPSSNVQRIQEGHITVAHIICELVEDKLYGKILNLKLQFQIINNQQ